MITGTAARCPPLATHPFGRLADLSALGLHIEIRTQADEVVETQLLLQEDKELAVGEAAVRHHGDAKPLGQHDGQQP
jgi:hypothetical protein